MARYAHPRQSETETLVREARHDLAGGIGLHERAGRKRKRPPPAPRYLAGHRSDRHLETDAARARLALLAEISQFLLASIDYRAAIAGLARLVLPALGDGCFVLLEGPNAGRSVALAHISPHKAVLLGKLDRGGGLTRLVGHAVASALRTGRPQHRNRVPSVKAETSPTDSESRALVAAIGPRAYMVMPLVTRGRVLGAMVLLITEGDRRYSSDDREFAQHVARRTATALDNLRLYDEARQARAAAEDASRLKDEFLTTLSHELRTPLNAILGWARILRDRPVDPATKDRALASIERNALVQTQIIEDLLDVSRLITGGLRLDLAPIDFCGLVDASITAIRPAADAKGIHLACRLERVGPMRGDSRRLQQIAWNLLSNATKFTPPGGRIDILLQRRAAAVVLRVSDTGAGISPQFLPHVFERFRQGDGTTTRAHSGLGLGLAIVRHLVELHGGTVEAESPGVGKGSTFTVRIPLHRATAQAGGQGDAPAEAGPSA